MADDMDQILNEVMGDPTTPEVEPTEEPEVDVEPTEPEVEPEVEVETKPAPPKQNQAWAQMRVQNKQYEQALANLAKQQGVTVDELINNLQNETDTKVAQKQGISPEIQKQLREQQEQLEALREERNRDRFRSGVETLRNQFNLSQDEMYSFIDQTREAGINLIESPIPMDLVYKALNHDTLLNQAVEKAKQELITRDQQISATAPTNTKTPSRAAATKQKAETPEQALKQLMDEGFQF